MARQLTWRPHRSSTLSCQCLELVVCHCLMSASIHHNKRSECGDVSNRARASPATHNATHNRSDLHVLGRTYAAVRNLQVVECAGSPQTEKADVGGSSGSPIGSILA